MAPPTGWTDERVEQTVGNLLRVGVLLSALVVLAGGLIYLVRHRDERVDYRFRGEPVAYSTVPGVIRAAAELRGRGLIQLGLLLLIATPIARVAFSVFAFLRQRDYTYLAVTLLVLAILLYGLFGQHP